MYVNKELRAEDACMEILLVKKHREFIEGCGSYVGRLCETYLQELSQVGL